MWTQDEFSWDSPTFKMPPRNVPPKPVQKPHPPIWMSGTQPESAILAGERGIGFMHFSLSDPFGMDAKVRSYRDALARARPVGEFIHDQFAAFTILFCGRDDADAAARAGEGATWYANLVELVYASLGTLSADQSYAWYRDRIAREAYRERDLQELVDRRSVIVGGARHCIESIEWYESQGVDMMLFLATTSSTPCAGSAGRSFPTSPDGGRPERRDEASDRRAVGDRAARRAIMRSHEAGMWDVPRMLRTLLAWAASGGQADASSGSEHEVELLRQRLGVARDRLRAVFDSSVIGVIVGDLDGAIREANDAFLWMVGYSREDLEAGRLDWIELTPPEQRPLDASAIGRLERRRA